MDQSLDQAACACTEEADYRQPFGKWMGWRTFFIKSLEKEGGDITTLYLYPVDGKAVPLAKAGQFICIEVDIPDLGPRRRNYSISSAPNEEYFRISVKEVKDGLVSPYLTSKAKIGDEFQISGAYGDFFLQPQTNRPIALICGGCGVAPIMSLVEEIVQKNYTNEVHYIYVTQDSHCEAFGQEIRKFAAEGHLKADIFYSRMTDSLPEDLKNLHHHTGRLSEAFLQKNIPQNADCYICGPQGVMFSTINTLRKMGIPREQLFYELNACI